MNVTRDRPHGRHVDVCLDQAADPADGPRLWTGDGVLRDPQTVLAAISGPISRSTPKGRVVEWNPAAEATFGYRREQTCGRLVQDLIILEQDRGRVTQCWPGMRRRRWDGGPGPA